MAKCCKLWQSFTGSVPLNESSARCASGRGGSPDRINSSGSDKSNWRKICGPRSLITVIVSLGYHRTINYPLKMAADLQSRISSGGRPLPIRQLFIHRCRMTMIVLLSADRVRELVAGHNGAVSLVQDAAPRQQRALLAVARVHHEISFNCLFVLEQHKATVHRNALPRPARIQMLWDLNQTGQFSVDCDFS